MFIKKMLFSKNSALGQARTQVFPSAALVLVSNIDDVWLRFSFEVELLGRCRCIVVQRRQCSGGPGTGQRARTREVKCVNI